MLTLKKTVDSTWEIARKSIRDDFETIERVLNRRWGATFGGSNKLAVSSISGAQALSRTNDTNVTLTLGGSPTTALLAATTLTLGWTGTLAAARLNANVVQAVTNDTNVTGAIAAQNLTLGWTGTLAVARGGIGVGTLTLNGLLYGNGTGAVQAGAALTNGKIPVAGVNGVLADGTIATLVAGGAAGLAATVALTNQGADIGSTTLTSTAGTYLVTMTLEDTTADGAAGSVTLTIGWTDGAGATTATAVQVLTATGRATNTFHVQLASGNLTYATTHTGVYGTAKYAVYISVIRLS